MTEIKNQDPLITALKELDEKKVLDQVHRYIADGVDPLEIINRCHRGMTQVGERDESGRYFISALIMAGEIMRQVGQLVLPLISTSSSKNESGRIVLGTVEGDIHFIGKDIFKLLVRSYGFAVHDLGVDVPPSRFLGATLEVQPDIVGLSCLISTAHKAIKETIDLLRHQLPPDRSPEAFVIGGVVDEFICRHCKADFWANDAMKGVNICGEIMSDRSILRS